MQSCNVGKQADLHANVGIGAGQPRLGLLLMCCNALSRKVRRSLVHSATWLAQYTPDTNTQQQTFCSKRRHSAKALLSRIISEGLKRCYLASAVPNTKTSSRPAA